jgi:hypothetical protein
VGWREFAHHLLYHFPQTAAQPLRAEFARFPWRADPGTCCALGNADAPGTRSSTPGCGNFGRRAGCTIGCA